MEQKPLTPQDQLRQDLEEALKRQPGLRMDHLKVIVRMKKLHPELTPKAVAKTVRNWFIGAEPDNHVDDLVVDEDTPDS